MFAVLCDELERVVQRPLFLNAYGAQAKYSLGKLGEPVHWHVDQLHEAFALSKYGDAADAALHQMQTRRGLSWLLYLSDDDWGEPGGGGAGGTLVAYPRQGAVGRVGSHQGNQQVGWLERGSGSEPVFLDCWVPPPGMEGRTVSDLRREWGKAYESKEELWAALWQLQPSYSLYCVHADGRREQLGGNHPTPRRDSRGERIGEPPSLQDMLPDGLRGCFTSTLCREHPQQRAVQVSPKGGTLVVFDPVVVPHEVLPVIAGDRLALFGFLAEERPVPQVWADNEKAHSAEAHSTEARAWFLDKWAFAEDG